MHQLLSGCDWTRTQNHVVNQQTLNHLAKPTMVECSLRINGSGFASYSSDLNLRYRICLEPDNIPNKTLNLPNNDISDNLHHFFYSSFHILSY